MIEALRLYSIGLARYWWLIDLIEHDTYDWWLDVIRATPNEIYRSPWL